MSCDILPLMPHNQLIHPMRNALSRLGPFCFVAVLSLGACNGMGRSYWLNKYDIDARSATQIVHRAQKERRWIAPEFLEPLKKASGRER